MLWMALSQTSLYGVCSSVYNTKLSSPSRRDGASAGWIGDGFDGVHVFNPEGKLIGFIKLPETASNLCFGGPKRNRLFITASQSLFSLYVNTRGAHHC